MTATRTRFADCTVSLNSDVKPAVKLRTMRRISAFPKKSAKVKSPEVFLYGHKQSSSTLTHHQCKQLYLKISKRNKILPAWSGDCFGGDEYFEDFSPADSAYVEFVAFGLYSLVDDGDAS